MIVADHGRVRAEARLPVVVAEHDDGVAADGLVVGGLEQPAERRLKAEHREVRAGHEHARRRSRLPLIGEVGAEGDDAPRCP